MIDDGSHPPLPEDISKHIEAHEIAEKLELQEHQDSVIKKPAITGKKKKIRLTQ
ncbi:hypothetical protein [Photobacterium angustum]|uniref:hypothetical protein n=1 Tax=Photobacterium angustum TaxID=661 RepID=UPI000A59070E|nr:hypothetical protein [Photobacterium angustum]